jgi:hypothetical protein
VIDAVGAVRADLLGASAMAWLAGCHALLGEAELATAILARARSWRRPGTIFDPHADVAEMWTLVAAGEPEAARRKAEASLDAAIDAHRWGQALDVAHALARVGGIGTANVALARITGRVDGSLADARQDSLGSWTFAFELSEIFGEYVLRGGRCNNARGKRSESR